MLFIGTARRRRGGLSWVRIDRPWVAFRYEDKAVWLRVITLCWEHNQQFRFLAKAPATGFQMPILWHKSGNTNEL
jgi:hypothetical protein